MRQAKLGERGRQKTKAEEGMSSKEGWGSGREELGEGARGREARPLRGWVSGPREEGGKEGDGQEGVGS